MESAQAFGQALRDLRQARGLTQENLAFEAGLERVFISMLERGVRQPTFTTILKLAAALECTASELVERAERLLR